MRRFINQQQTTRLPQAPAVVIPQAPCPDCGKLRANKKQLKTK